MLLFISDQWKKISRMPSDPRRLASGSKSEGSHLPATGWRTATFLFPCVVCGLRTGALLRGKCRTCAPEEHAAYDLSAARFNAAFAAYEQETGREVLADWQAWEEWATTHPEAFGTGIDA